MTLLFDSEAIVSSTFLLPIRKDSHDLCTKLTFVTLSWNMEKIFFLVPCAWGCGSSTIFLHIPSDTFTFNPLKHGKASLGIPPQPSLPRMLASSQCEREFV